MPLSVADWYIGTDNRISMIETLDGYELSNASVQNLVSAMAAMTPLPVGQTDLNATEHTQLDSVIVAN